MFDSLNVYILKGDFVEGLIFLFVDGMSFVFDSFMMWVGDEFDFVYGLVVLGVWVEVDGFGVIFFLWLEVWFYDGIFLIVEDVVFFFLVLKE